MTQPTYGRLAYVLWVSILTAILCMIGWSAGGTIAEKRIAAPEGGSR